MLFGILPRCSNLLRHRCCNPTLIGRSYPAACQAGSECRTVLDGVIDFLLAAQHALEMFRRALPMGAARSCLDRFSNRDQDRYRSAQTPHTLRTGRDWPVMSASGELSSGACTRHCWPSTRHYAVTQDPNVHRLPVSGKGDLSSKSQDAARTASAATA
jgi:hypothetical protein